MSDQSAHSLLFPHSIELIYLIAASDTLPERLFGRCFKSDKFSPTHIAKRLYYCGATKSPHEAKRERVGEERTKPELPTHTSLVSSLKELLYSSTWRGAKALCPAKNKHFHRQSQAAFWQGRATLLFLDKAFSAQTFRAQSWKTWHRDNGRLQGSWSVLISIWRFNFWPERISLLTVSSSITLDFITSVL